MGDDPNTVHGMYLCRGDITSRICKICVRTATRALSKNCTHHKEAFIFYEECMVRYSDFSFLTLLEGPSSTLYSTKEFPTTSRFGQTLSGTMDKLIESVTFTSKPIPYFVVGDKQPVSVLDKTFSFDSMVQCSPDLDPTNCTVCLRLAVQDIMDCCSRSRSAQIFLPKCLVKYDTTSLYVASPGGTKGNKSGSNAHIPLVGGKNVYISFLFIYLLFCFFFN